MVLLSVAALILNFCLPADDPPVSAGLSFFIGNEAGE